jgi:hypothetical protein
MVSLMVILLKISAMKAISLSHIISTVSVFLIAGFSEGCSKTDTRPEHYTVCITCVRIISHDTLPDHCTRDDFAQIYINSQASYHHPITGDYDPRDCRIRK